MESLTVELNKRFSNLFPNCEPVRPGLFLEIENALKIHLPADFKEISNFFDGTNGFFSAGMFCFDRVATPTNVINETIKWRELSPSLPLIYLGLAHYDESFIVLNVLTNEVLWLELYAYESICEGVLFTPYKIFPTFADFFKYLLDEEEKSRAEDEVAANKKD